MPPVYLPRPHLQQRTCPCDSVPAPSLRKEEGASLPLLPIPAEAWGFTAAARGDSDAFSLLGCSQSPGFPRIRKAPPPERLIPRRSVHEPQKTKLKNVEVAGPLSSEDEPYLPGLSGSVWEVGTREQRGRGVVQPAFSSGRSLWEQCGWTQVCVGVFSFCQ